jgi:hypothetical protein
MLYPKNDGLLALPRLVELLLLLDPTSLFLQLAQLLVLLHILQHRRSGLVFSLDSKGQYMEHRKKGEN